MRVTSIIGLVWMVALAAVVSARPAEAPEESGAPSIFIRAPSAEHSKQIAVSMAALSRSLPLSAERAGSVRRQVGEIPLWGSKAKSVLAVRSLGYGALPIIEQLLLSQDDATRRKAVMALRFLTITSLSKERVSEYPEHAEEALIDLFRRAALDRVTRIRQEAIGALTNMALVRHRQIPAAIQTALEAAARSDPDPDLRDAAQFSLEHLGLAPPTHREGTP